MRSYTHSAVTTNKPNARTKYLVFYFDPQIKKKENFNVNIVNSRQYIICIRYILNLNSTISCSAHVLAFCFRKGTYFI